MKGIIGKFAYVMLLTGLLFLQFLTACKINVKEKNIETMVIFAYLPFLPLLYVLADSYYIFDQKNSSKTLFFICVSDVIRYRILKWPSIPTARKL